MTIAVFHIIKQNPNPEATYHKFHNAPELYIMKLPLGVHFLGKKKRKMSRRNKPGINMPPRPLLPQAIFINLAQFYIHYIHFDQIYQS